MFNEKGEKTVPSHSAKRRMKDFSIDNGLENDEKRFNNNNNTSNNKGNTEESLRSMDDNMQLQPSKEVDESSVADIDMSSSKMADQSSSVLDDISKYLPSKKMADSASSSILVGLSNGNNSLFAEEQDSQEEDINILAMSTMMNQSTLNDEEYSLLSLKKQENNDDESEAYDLEFDKNGSCFSLDLSQIVSPEEVCSKLQDICSAIKNDGKSNEEAFKDLYQFLHENAPYDSTNDSQMIQIIGKEVIETLQKEKSLKKNLHLLAFFRGGHLRKDDASRLLAPKSISHDIWNEAGKHRRLVGAGKVDSEEKQIRHRRHIEEKTIQDFVEWLNAADLLQNLAYGEKIVRVNGFHVAIESVKRTTSIQNIIRKYYWQFLDGAENKDEESDCVDNAIPPLMDQGYESADEEDEDNAIPPLMDRGYESADEEDEDDDKHDNEGKTRRACKFQLLYYCFL